MTAHTRRAAVARAAIAALVAVTEWAAGGGAFAQPPEPTALIDQQHCMFCHTVDRPFLAPSFRQIAERYRDQPQASTMLESKLVHGGKAHWGDMPMPPPPERGGPLSAKDAHTLVQWVLDQ
ncbi:MAG TPA: c-type cytochrome [Trinickia sp.]|nr:c-type cytochrome [Trinickia sp.]